MSQLRLTLLSDGSCAQMECLAIRGGRIRSVSFGSMFALIEHPGFGPILFDTGYTSRFLEETRRFPEKFYSMITPVKLNSLGDAASQLSARGISPGDVRHVIVSHFHADHIGGLRDFPNARFHCTRSGWSAVEKLKGIAALRKAYLPGLMPQDFGARAWFAESAPKKRLPDRYIPFSAAWDLLGDGTLMGVELPGHAPGQMGVFLSTSDDRDWLLAGDACWLSRSYRESLSPHPLVRLIVEWKTYNETLMRINRLHHNNSAVNIIPSHCPEIWRRQ